MDESEVINTFRLTLNPDYTKEAEKKLQSVKHCQNFPQVLMRIVECENLEETVRHSAVIMLKNIVKEKWAHEESARELMEQQKIESDMHLTDKKFLEVSLVNAALGVKTSLLRDQLVECIHIILKRAFPAFMGGLPAHLVALLVSENALAPGLHMLLVLLKSQSYNGEDRLEKLIRELQQLGGVLAKVVAQYSPLDLEEACEVTIVCYKIFMELAKRGKLIKFMGEGNLVRVLDDSLRLYLRPAPSSAPLDGASPSVWSKCRKWAIRIFYEIFRRERHDKQFMAWFMGKYAGDVINCIFSLFNRLSQGEVVSDYVVQYSMLFLRLSITKLACWTMISSHLVGILNHIFIRLLSYDEKFYDEFHNDPLTFVEDYCIEDYMLYPESGIMSFLRSVAKHRSEALSSIVNCCVHLLADCSDSQRYAAFTVLGAISKALVKSDVYKNDMEHLFVKYIFPATSSENPIIRYRAFWVLETLINVPFRDSNNQLFVVERIVHGILHESSLAVQYSVVQLFHSFMGCTSDITLRAFVPYIKSFTLKMLGLVKELNCHQTPYTIEKMFDVFSENVADVACELIQHSMQLILPMVSLGQQSSLVENMPIVSGIVSAIDTIVESLGDNLVAIQQVEPLIDQIVNLCFVDELIIEMWDDLCMLLCTVTNKRVGACFWKYFYRFMEVFPSNVGLYSFEAMVDWIHNFVTVDCEAFMANPDNLARVQSTVEKAMDNEENDYECFILGLKIYDVILITCRGKLSGEQMRQMLHSIYNVYSTSVTKDNRDLVVLCVMTFVAALYCDYEKAFSLCSAVVCVSQNLLINEILSTWTTTLANSECNRHQLKLSLLVIVELLNSSDPISRQHLPSLMPLSMVICSSLNNEYQKSDDDAEEEEEEEFSDGSSIGSMDYEGNESTQTMEGSSMDQMEDEEDGLYMNDDYDEVYTTFIDEKKYDMVELIVFTDRLRALQETDGQLFCNLLNTLNAQQRQQLTNLSDRMSQLKLERHSVQH